MIANYEFETDGSVRVILDSIERSSTKVVAVFADPDQYIPEMLQLKENINPQNNIVFISSRYWELERMGLTRRYPESTAIATNSLSFRLADSTVADFMNYLGGLTLPDSSNPWLPEYYQVGFSGVCCVLFIQLLYTEHIISWLVCPASWLTVCGKTLQ